MLRDFKPQSPLYTQAAPPLVCPDQDAYVCSVLAHDRDTQEVAVWAATSANLWSPPDLVVQNEATPVFLDDATILVGDTTTRILLKDQKDRTIASVESLIVRRGDSQAEIQLFGQGTFDPRTSIFTITGGFALGVLSGGVSQSRGDQVILINTKFAGATFWWSRNDAFRPRVQWNGTRGRWEPRKGTSTRDLGQVLPDTTYTLSPVPTVAVGEKLPGNQDLPDSYSMLRVGITPNRFSTPLAEPPPPGGYSGVLVVSSEEAAEFDFTGSDLAGILDASTGTLTLSPAFAESFAGQHLFFSYRDFLTNTTEPVGEFGEDLYVAPVPETWEYPLIRVGSRQHLEAILTDTEDEADALVLQEGQVGVARSTGKIRFSDADLQKADPSSTTFDLLWLDQSVFYDGVSLTERPVPLMAPVACTDEGGSPTTIDGFNELYVPLGSPWPLPGTCGIQWVPDGTGTPPNTSAEPGIRPNGCGLLRGATSTLTWDSFFFSKSGVIEKLTTVTSDEEIPRFLFKIPRGEALLDLRAGPQGASQVHLGRQDRRRRTGETLYFAQTILRLTHYAPQVRVWSDREGPFEFEGSESFSFSIDGVGYTWSPSAGTYTAQEVATQLDALVGQSVTDTLLDHLALKTPSLLGRLEIGGYGEEGVCAVLGFTPGTIVQVSDPPAETDLHWVSPSGLMMGFFRSPLNLDGQDDIPDVRALNRVEDASILDRVSPSSVFFLQENPLVDLPGYETGIFFELTRGLGRERLLPYNQLWYRFDEDRVIWTTSTEVLLDVPVASPTFNLGVNGVVPPALQLPGHELELALPGESFEVQVLGEDFELISDGAPGLGIKTIPVGTELASGAQGASSGATFTDAMIPSWEDVGASVGDHLDILRGDLEGVYRITGVSGATLTVDPPFSEDAGGLSWSLWDASETLIEGIIADLQYKEFSVLPEEPFKVRVLTDLGEISDQDLSVSLGPALTAGRTVSLRIGLPNSSPSRTLTFLATEELGILGQSTQLVPAGLHRTLQAFTILIGSKVYSTADATLVFVAVLSDDLPGDVVEVDDGGRLGFGTETLSSRVGSTIFYREVFLPSANIPSGTAEVDSDLDLIRLNSSDQTTYAGTHAYFVQSLTAGVDVTLNPIQGSLAFSQPLLEKQVVEAEYFLAQQGTGDLFLASPGDGAPPAPVRVIEFLPLTISLEEATYTDEYTWSFNPTQRTIDEEVSVLIYIDSTLCNVGNSPVARTKESKIFFDIPVPSSSVVRISYGVLESFGGEQTYTVSTPPVYRPPLRIEESQTSFDLDTDRTSDIQIGMLLRVEASTFYVTNVVYDAAEDLTTISITPSPITEVGSRNPSTGALTVLTDRALTEPEDFWGDVEIPYDPINRGYTSIILSRAPDFRVIPGHILEIGGHPYTIIDTDQDESGRFTVSIASGFTEGYAYGIDALRISTRPIYPPNSSIFLGRYPVSTDDPYEVILFTPGEPGRKLTLNVDAVVDVTTGEVQLLSAPLAPLQTLYLRYTAIDTLAPEWVGGAPQNPRIRGDIVHTSSPSLANGRLGEQLFGTFTYYSPDTWYFEVLPVLTLMQRVQSTAATGTTGPAFGQPISLPASPEGLTGIRGDIRETQTEDQAARRFLILYHGMISLLEEVAETLSGEAVGDRDGKFRYELPIRLPPYPGAEDPVSGDLVSRNVFTELYSAFAPAIHFQVSDPLADPSEAILVDGVLEGPYIDPDFLDELIFQQRLSVRNDIDDTVLIGRSRKKLKLFPRRLESFGRYAKMGLPHRLSRLYPEKTDIFTLTDPGLLADLEANPVEPGVYAFRKKVTRARFENGVLIAAKRASTFNLPIATLENPVLGQLSSISDISLRDRLPRARILAYSATGFPELDVALLAAGETTFASQPRPAVLVSLIPWKEFPWTPEGDPDVSLLASQGGQLYDLTTGDPDLSTPAWEPSEDNPLRVAWGVPDGRTLDLVSSKTDSYLFGLIDYEVALPIFVREVMLGCLVTFQDEDGDPILSGTQILEAGDLPFTSGGVALFQPGDSLLIVPPEFRALTNVDDPPTQEERDDALKGRPDYRVRFDVKVDRTEGEILDISLPSYRDPSILGLKEILGQAPPKPLTTLEGTVRFKNSNTEPTQFPALLGEALLDNGDVGVPYLYLRGTELDILGESQAALNALVTADSPVPSAVYPDERLGEGSLQNAALATPQDMTPVTTAGGYTPHSGVGDVRPWDLLLVETGQSVDAGAMGILSVGKVESGRLFPARWVTPTSLGDRIRYNIRSAMSFVLKDLIANPPGMVVRRVGNITFFDITSVSQGILVFNDGSGAIQGGLNNLFDPGAPFAWSLNNDNIIRIHLWIPGDPATYLQAIEIRGNVNAPTATGDLGAQAINVVPSASDQVIFVDTGAPFVTIGAGPPPALPEDPDNPGQTIPLWFTIDIDTTNGPGASLTGIISEDRVSFEDTLDFRTVLPRTTPKPDPVGPDVFTTLEVPFVTSKTTDACTVNGAAEVNGGLPFTFLEAGSFASVLQDGDGRGSLAVPAYEGHSNTPLVAGGSLTFSAVASSTYDTQGILCQGTGTTGTTSLENYRIFTPSVSAGSLDAVVPGDLCVITGSDDIPAKASTKAGTYIVRHRIVPNNGTDRRELILSTGQTLNGPAFTNTGFPSLVSSTITDNSNIRVSSTTLADGSLAWDAAGTIYILTVLDPTSPNYTTSNYKIDYTSVTADGLFFVDQLTATDFAGVLPATDAIAAIDALEAATIAGMRSYDIRLQDAPEDVLPQNTVGFDHGVTTAAGFLYLRVVGDGGDVVTTFGGAPPLVLAPAPLPPDGVRITAGTVAPAFDFAAEDAYVYGGVASLLEVSLSNAQWDAIHTLPGLYAVMPSDAIRSEDAVNTPGFIAQAGLFFEPSTPRPTLDYAGALERVVDAAHSLDANTTGFRDGALFGEAPTEPVSFEVRRIRRWHVVQDEIQSLLQPLQAAYKIRRGVIQSYGPALVGTSPALYPFVVGTAGTNLGPLNDPTVNIRVGDRFRVLADGELQEEAEIAGLAEDGLTLWLKSPGILTPNPVGLEFEIFLRTAPVPGEQTTQELLETITQKVLVERTADYGLEDGGFVPIQDTPQDPRILRDTDEDIDFEALGVQEGDILLIDPAGLVEGPTGVPASGQEVGVRPFGDRSVPSRTVAQGAQEVPFIAGGPSELDDNRGWYRIAAVRSNEVEVEEGTLFTGSLQTDVTFGSSAEYAVYPTISGSEATFADPPGGPGREGQMALRPTAFAGENGSPSNSYQGNLFSIAPLSYRIFRPLSIFSEEAVDTVLGLRERMLSWIEVIEAFFLGQKSGTYFIFQKDEHISDLGDPTVVVDGKGLISNALVDDIRGLVNISPFANTSDALSILQRRFWGLDTRLDQELPPYQGGVPSYATLESNDLNLSASIGDGRPVLPDHIDDILDFRDRLRALRFAWIRARVHRTEGTLARIEQLLSELSKNLRERQEQLERQRASL